MSSTAHDPSAPPYPDAVVIHHQQQQRNIDSPPTYEDSTDPNSMPPTYESLYGEFQQVDNPRGLAQFIAKVFAILIGTVTAAILLAVLNIIPLGMLIVGIINLSNCRIEPYIPIWLIVTGVFSLLKSATNFFYRARRQRLQQQQQQPSAIPSNINPNPFDGLLSTFLLVWFIIGSVWVYSVYDDVQYTNADEISYCDQFTYVFSFMFITIGYMLLICTMCCFCCCCCCVCCRPKRNNSIIQ